MSILTRSISEGVCRRPFQVGMTLPRLRFGLVWVAAATVSCFVAAEESPFKAEKHDDRFVITHGGRPVAIYVFRDEKILRPYFAHVHAPDGTQVTRHHPPRPGVDAVDHDTMHPGIWLAFGDLGGADFWRNKGRVEYLPGNDPVTVEDDSVRIAGVNRYLDGDEVGVEIVARTISVLGDGYLFQFGSSFIGKKRCVFGDQEEMGLGLRLATPLAVKGGSGTITNSAGGKNEKEVWGQQADWCDYSGIVEKDGAKRRAGMLLIPHKDNFRRSWFHARDYGFIAANPFGQNAFTKGEKSRIEVKPGDKLDLRFGIWIYSTPADKPPDLAAVAKEYHQLTGGR
jgi:hypothetical protein